MQRYLVLNGPNLNLLGTREPDVYGTTTLAELDDACRQWGAELDVEIDTAQSNHEGSLIDRLHDARDSSGVIFNPGAYTHTSYALHDAIQAIEAPTVEVHISNVEERESWRKISVVRPACVGTIYGRGLDGYRWAIRHLFHRTEWDVDTIRYAGHAEGVIDVRRPVTPGPHAAVVLVHGGFWRHMWTRDIMEGVAIDLARRGFLSANIEYRRVGSGGGWPTTIDDVAAAITHVASLPDVSRVAVVGHSAGGHLALMARARVEAPFLPVVVGAVLDMEAAVARKLGEDAAAAFLGGASAREASPVSAAAKGDVVVVHGTADDRVPVDQAQSYVRANPDAELLELADIGHSEALERSHTAWLQIAEVLERRLRS